MSVGLAEIQKGIAGVQGAVGDVRKILDDQSEKVATLEKSLAEGAARYEARLKAIEEAKASAGVATAGLLDPSKARFQRSFSFHDVLKKVSKIGLDKLSQCEYPADMRTKIMSTEVGADGAYTIPPQMAAELIERLKARQVLPSLGIRTYTVDEGFGQVLLPRHSAGATFNWIGEASTPTDSTPQFELPIASIKRNAAVVEVPNDLLRMNGVDLEDALLRDFIEDAALAADIAGLRGSGSSFQPRGVVNTPGVNSTGAGTPNGGPVTIDLLLELQRLVMEDNSRMASPGYVMHSNVWHQMMKIVENSQHIYPSVHYAPGVVEKPGQRILGHMIALSNQIPVNLVEGTSSNLSEIYFGDWSDLVQVRWGGLEVRVSKEAHNPTTGRSAYTQDLTFFLIIQKLDFVVRHAGSFAVVTDVASS